MPGPKSAYPPCSISGKAMEGGKKGAGKGTQDTENRGYWDSGESAQAMLSFFPFEPRPSCIPCKHSAIWVTTPAPRCILRDPKEEKKTTGALGSHK